MAIVNKPFSGSGLRNSAGRFSVQNAAIGPYYANGTIPTPTITFNTGTISINEKSSVQTFETTAFNGYNTTIKGGTSIEATLDGYVAAYQADANSTLAPTNNATLNAGDLAYLFIQAGSLRYEGGVRIQDIDFKVGPNDNASASIKFVFHNKPNYKQFTPLTGTIT